MMERLQGILKKITNWWNRFESKQKTIIIMIAVAVLMAVVILFTIVARPQMVHLVTLDSAKNTSEIQDMLEAEGISPTISDDGREIKVKSSDKSQANLILAENGVPSATYEFEDIFSGGFTSTSSDTQLRYVAYLESNLEVDLASYDFIKKASVTIKLPENDGTLIAKEEEGYVSILLDLNGEMTGDVASGIAVMAKNIIGNSTTENITIADTQGNLWYSGEDSYSSSGNASNQLTVKQQAENLVKNEVKNVLVGLGYFGRIEVASNLVLDFSTSDIVEHKFDVPDGQEEGLVTHEEIYNAESVGGVSGVPGTDSNTETTYMYQDNEYSSQTTSEESRDLVVNETVTTQSIPPGLIVYNQSSISVTAISYRKLSETDAKKQGLLDGISWDEYKLANNERVKLEVDEDIYKVVSGATGIGIDDISIVAYEEPLFEDKEGFKAEPKSIIQIVLIVLILGLLAFVVLRTMMSDTDEAPEEIAVENLLQSMPDEEIEQINMEAKSETRRVIEKFVEDNPEAVASLLRNWLGESWGGN